MIRPVLLALALVLAGAATAMAQAPVIPGLLPPAPAPAGEPLPPVEGAPASALPLVAIDPGHGGGDPGAVGRLPAGTPTGLPERESGSRILEKDVNLDISHRLDALLRARGYPTVMTRTQDAGAGDRPYRGLRADLRARVEIANAARAGLFLSIHSNAFRSDTTGTETFHFHATGRPGRALARAVHDELLFRLRLPDRGVRPAGFFVLRFTNMPAVLVEGGFLSNPSEALLFARPEFRQLVAEGVAAGVERFVREGGLELRDAPVRRPVNARSERPRYWVSAGVYRRSAPARVQARRVQARGFEAIVRRRDARSGRPSYHVVTGQFISLTNAKSQRQALREALLPGIVGSAAGPREQAERRGR